MDGVTSQLTITPIDGGLALAGEIDGRTAPELQASVSRHLAASPDLRLDMSGVSFMDSSGLRVLLAALAKADESGGALVLSSITPAVVRLLELSKLDGHFTVVDS